MSGTGALQPAHWQIGLHARACSGTSAGHWFPLVQVDVSITPWGKERGRELDTL
jgi:hypothetical protein